MPSSRGSSRPSPYSFGLPRWLTSAAGVQQGLQLEGENQEGVSLWLGRVEKGQIANEMPKVGILVE